MDIEFIPHATATVVRLPREQALNTRNREEFYDRLSAAIAAAARPVFVLDGAPLTAINSTALATLVALLGQARARGGTFALAGLRAPVRDLIEMSVKQLFPIYDDVAAALAGLPQVW